LIDLMIPQGPPGGPSRPGVEGRRAYPRGADCADGPGEPVP